jgi:hypothetical protein
MRFQDLTGEKFNRLTVVKRVEGKLKKHTYWECVCDCGNTTIVTSQKLKNEKTKSCGCYARDINTKHGMWKTRLYGIWRNMKCRCYTPNATAYDCYGGRGIVVCDDWKNDFMSFYNWAYENGYKDDLTLDRIDVDGNYEPSNCRWATMKVQSNNTRSNHIIEYNGEKHTMTEWAEILGMKRKVLEHRIERGWTTERAFTQKVQKHTKVK